LIKDPDILIFDEPTSALDAVTENSILQLLPEVLRGKTLFIAAHRLSTIKHADRILILNNGRVTGIGTHAELLDVNEYYRSLFTCDSSNTNALST
jgi:ABC-type multidrug transport system fused ATPase/permease subunit